VRRVRSEKSDLLVRIGYAAGTRTHQRDFAVASNAVARVLREREQCRLVLFRFDTVEGDKAPGVDIGEFAAFEGLEGQIEWREMVPLADLPGELARFDVNIAPLEAGNVFCEAKSELKFFESALVDVPTVASPTEPYRSVIRHGENGYLANDPEDWYAALLLLVDDPLLRVRLGRAAQRDALWRFGPLRRADAMFSAIPQLLGNTRGAAHALALEACRNKRLKSPQIRVFDFESILESDQLGLADVTVIVPFYNYAEHVRATLESVRAQTLEALDLIVVGNPSANTSLSEAVEWVRHHANRFNRAVVLRNLEVAGVSAALNAAIDAVETAQVLVLPAECWLLPECCSVCLSTLRHSGASFAIPKFRDSNDTGNEVRRNTFDPSSFTKGDDVIDLAMVSKEAWAAVGGYAYSNEEHVTFDFVKQLVEFGLWGTVAGDGPVYKYHVGRDSRSA
jgi:Glycosyl transferase family 2/Glycosyl transferases group 1